MKTHRHSLWARGAIVGTALVCGLVAGCSGDGSDGEKSPTETPGPAMSEVPAPNGGDISETVPAVEPTVLDPVGLTESVDVDGVVFELTAVERTTVEATGPGEVGGEAVAVTVSVTNGTDAPVDVDGAVVTLLQGDGNVGVPSPAEPTAPLTGTVEPGKSAEGVYAFSTIGGAVDPITVSVGFVGDAATVVYQGDLA